MTSCPQNTNDGTQPNRIVTAGLLVWMLGLMLLGWFVMDGPGMSSLVKRVAPLKRAQQTLRCALGESADPTSHTDGETQP